MKVSFDKNIESEKASIKFAQGTWNVIMFPIFENNQIVKPAVATKRYLLFFKKKKRLNEKN